ncbi:SusD/RagB family nutrient-binding outer membrane lipoprotein [Sphingobacterium bovistauri]|uniref:SusD/RagB family nutrient-binding outer membrane lipoprotein n=1 Tax=Sphingobacterium bovistauri TaxID=2781959 RepID=A0ABS7Z972_9SPHI|nr:SusD/RagB family nutrient-binding outer membrane lipoprotein [Sphingobacterium bovistauri]MCA5006709.1 SusD/RagB family nutrient-binding outer membrane lipoprotein [Sphingobacterium bovistauri]
MKINKIMVIAGLCTASLTTNISCKKSSFDELYRDPSKVTETTVEKQFSGLQFTYRELVVPTYRNYFVTLAPTIHRYIQTVGWSNSENQLLPGAAAITDRWERYYQGLAQFRELEKVYNTSVDAEKADKKIFLLAAKIFFYDQTQQQVDLHGSIPWSEAGKLSSNGGNYGISYPKYDKAEDIYTVMLDDLKAISSELNNLSISAPVLASFKTQDLINSGSVDLWKKYCNSLRLRMLTRVSQATSFATRSTQEINEIINTSTTFPLVLENKDNIQVDIFNNGSDINAKGFQDAIESWNNNIAGKLMIDHMKNNKDPRLSYMFEPGAGANGDYIGLDQSLTSSVQSALIAGTPTAPSTIAIYNRSTYTRNQNFPGILITASEVHYLLAEFKQKNGNPTGAKSNFESGIKESIDLQKRIRTVSNNSLLAAPTEPTTTDINTYITNIGWGSNNIQLIAMQKWLHFNIIQSLENWAEVRRLNYPILAFRVENSDIQKVVPVKWNLPQSEQAYNLDNYDIIKDQDNINTKLFWDSN